MRLRPIAAADHADALASNQTNVALLAPLDRQRLEQLIAWSDTAAVIDVDDAFAGFVLTFASGAAYDGDNFAWFADRYPAFTYLDRVVIHPDFRRRGLATQAYDALESASPHPAFCLEVNVDPPNEPSLAFHRARGFTEVGRRVIDPGTPAAHTVAMLVKELPQHS